MVEQPSLSDAAIFPDALVLSGALGPVYETFQSLVKTVESMAGLLEWRYYRDGKAWLCKVLHKKNTVCWISVWPTCFKVAFYFTEKNRAGVEGLEIDRTALRRFGSAQPIGRLLPFVFELRNPSDLTDTVTVLRYKMALK